MNNFVITGCAGFIGSHVADVFHKNGHNILGIDKLTYAGKNLSSYPTGQKFSNVDICEEKLIRNLCRHNKIDCIINFAAETHVDNSIKGHDSFISSNVQGVKSLLEVCKTLDIPLVQISTDEVYGPAYEKSFDENSRLNPQNYYSATKAAAEFLVSAYHNTFDVQYLIVRMSNNYGPRQHKEKFLPTILRNLSEGLRIPLYGKGDNIRDWIYVEDSARIIYNLVMEGSLNEVYNISLKDEKTNTEVINIILDTLDMDWDENVEHVEDRLGHDFRYSITNDKIQKFVNFKPTTFAQGVNKTIASLNLNLKKEKSNG